MGLICAIRYHAAIPKVMEKLTNFNIEISTYFKILLFYISLRLHGYKTTFSS